MMYETPKQPNAGGSITAEWGRNLVRALRSAMPVAGPGMLIRKGTYGTVMTPLAQGGKAVAGAVAVETTPFTIRWFDQNKEDAARPDPNKGEWQIYLPAGSVVLRTFGTIDGGGASNFIATNEKATDEEGEVIDGWYKLETPKDNVDDDVSTATGKVARVWTVHLLMLPWGRLTATAMPSEFASKTFLWDEIVGRINVTTYSPDETGNTEPPFRSGSKGTRTYIEKEWSSAGEWGVEYRFDDGQEDVPGAQPKVHLVNQGGMVGRLDLTIDDDTDITSWTGSVSVWVKITHSNVKFELTVEKDLKNAEAQSDDNKTVYKIYDIKDHVVTGDWRALNKLDTNTVFYTSARQNAE